MIDLFGNEVDEPTLPAPAPKQLDLLTTAAELAAFASGRPLSQERAAIVAGDPDPVLGPLFGR